MIYYIKFSHPENTYLEDIRYRNGMVEEVLYTKDLSRAKIYEDEERARMDAEIIPQIHTAGGVCSVRLAT